MRYVLLLALSQVADVASTGFSLSHGSTEMNPLVKMLLVSGGLGLLLLFKLGLVVFAALLVKRAIRINDGAVTRINTILIIMSAMFFGVAGWNLIQ